MENKIKLANDILQSFERNEDIIQETLINIFKKLDKYNDEYAFSTFVNLVHRNTRIDYYRKKKRRDDKMQFVELSVDFLYEEEDEEQDILEKIEQLLKHKNILTKKEQRVLELFLIKKRTRQQIMESENISENNIRIIFHRIKNKMKKNI